MISLINQERWFLRQEQNKLSALQSSLDKEREQILIEKDQNRLSHEEFRVISINFSISKQQKMIM